MVNRKIERCLGEGFIAEVIGKIGTVAIIKCDYSTDNFKVGDPARVDPYKKSKSKTK